ncbi:MAG: porphobilinogen synthase [Akkermansia sp.]|nr:porphobilinogen synthase [Akkermansia sp.]
MMHLPIRPRRNRKSANIRELICETSISPKHLIYPVFIHEGDDNQPISSLPGCTRWSIPGLVEEAKRLVDLGIRTIDLFPAIPDSKKTPDAIEALNPEGLVPRAIYALKDAVPDLTIMTDVALDPYNSDGHDGLVEFRADGTMEILNDDTVEILCQQALCHADAGADIISPSDMMDGRVAAIRATLDSEALDDVSIMAYTAKYASALYGPFRGALESAPKSGDKKTYQMDPANIREAMREAQLDEAEGADILMVKPASIYLDVIAAMRNHVTLPIAAYHVSGEYLMIKSAAASGWLNEKATVLETLTSIRRAGADMILTYYAPQAAEWLNELR